MMNTGLKYLVLLVALLLNGLGAAHSNTFDQASEFLVVNLTPVHPDQLKKDSQHADYQFARLAQNNTKKDFSPEFTEVDEDESSNSRKSLSNQSTYPALRSLLFPLMVVQVCPKYNVTARFTLANSLYLMLQVFRI